jgi:elongation factor G
MERDFKLNVRVHRPRVSYRETIRTAKEVRGEFNRQAAGVTQRAAVKVRAEPLASESGVVVDNRLKPGTLPKELAATLEQAIRDEAAGGGSLGFPLMHVKFTILDADYSPTETTDVAVQAAAMDAVRQALNEGGVVLLEPIMKLEVVTPEEFLGNIQSDLLARKAAIVSTEQRGELRVLGAEAPLARMFGYSTQVRSLSQGRASYSMEPLKYSEAPAETLQEMMG